MQNPDCLSPQASSSRQTEFGITFRLRLRFLISPFDQRCEDGLYRYQSGSGDQAERSGFDRVDWRCHRCGTIPEPIGATTQQTHWTIQSGLAHANRLLGKITACAHADR
jgi:hypothetical protein